MKTRELNLLNEFLTLIYFSEENIKIFLDKLIRIPFGYYYMMKATDTSLITISELKFMKFYYWDKFKLNKNQSHLKIYKNLASNINFNKNDLEFLERKTHNELEIVKIIRRNKENKDDSKKTDIKVIIKFELNQNEQKVNEPDQKTYEPEQKLNEINQKPIESEQKLNELGQRSNDGITPDIIQKIILISSKKEEIIIDNKDIFYDNNNDITAYAESIKENVNIDDVIIVNYFSGEMKAKYILNIQGAGPTGKMLYCNIEKLLLIPFFKLFEIFYISQNDETKYKELKKENFGENFDDLKIIKPFVNQIKALNELLLYTRPDILASKESKFKKMYIEDEISLSLIY